MAKLVTIFGGSGFIGRYIARRMAKQGWRVRVASRHPNEALFVKTFGTVGQVEPVFCNIRNDASVAEVLDGADAAVNCVGILIEDKNNTLFKMFIGVVVPFLRISISVLVCGTKLFNPSSLIVALLVKFNVFTCMFLLELTKEGSKNFSKVKLS